MCYYYSNFTRKCRRVEDTKIKRISPLLIEFTSGVENRYKSLVTTIKWNRPECQGTRALTGAMEIPDCKLYYKAIMIETTWCRTKQMCKALWNRLEDAETFPDTFSYLPATKGPKASAGGKVACTARVPGKAGYLCAEHWNRTLSLSTY